MGCGGEGIPDRLIGIWEATSPTHRGRFIEISQEHIIFSSDENHSTFYTIRGVESRELEGEFSYTIEYSGVDDDRRRLVLKFSNGEPLAIELENKAGSWVRKNGIRSKQKESI